MLSWQQQGYLDRAIWQSELFTANALFFQESFYEGYQYGMLSYEESKIFQDLGLEKPFWIPRICRILQVTNLKDLKEIENHNVIDCLEQFRDINPSKRYKLISLFAELNCLYFPPSKAKSLTDLSKYLTNRKEYFVNNREDDDEAKFKDLIHELESIIWNWEKCSGLSYEYLVCIATLSLFGFDVEVSRFTIIPNEKQLETLSSMLSENLKDLAVFHKIEEKQAYVLNIAMSNYFGKTKVVPYILRKLPDPISQEVSIPSFPRCGEKDLAKLQNAIKYITSGNYENAFKYREKFLAMCFQSIFSQKVSTTVTGHTTTGLSESLKSFLQKLELLQYYPKKLTHVDVMKLTEDACNNVNKKPSSLAKIPWYFIRKMLGLNSTVRETGSAVETKPKSETESDDDSDSGWSDTSDENAVHPLDLIYAVFICADDFLRQELVDKMTKCQYAVPFILPSPEANRNESESEILHWGLKTISMTYSEGKEGKLSVTKTMVNVECPLVSCLHLGENVPGKSRILNEMLGDNLNNFWHEGLEGGKRDQEISQGMVEVSWHLPGSRATDKFETPVTFANMRGDAQKYPLVTEKLSKSSTITCIFTQTIDSISKFLENTFGKDCTKRIIMVLLHKPDDKINLKQLKESLKELKLKKFKMISCPFEDKHFFEVHKKLLKRLRIAIKKTTDERKSLTSLVNNLRSMMKVDDGDCLCGDIAAKNVLDEIHKIRLQHPDSVKSEIFPCQSDTVTRKKIGTYDKEICRYTGIKENEDIEQYASKKKQEKWKLQWQQLQLEMSKTFANFLKYMINFNSLNRKYFLQSLKLGLNERSADTLQPLYDEYKKYLQEGESVERRKELNEQLTYSSFGLEHFFRELAVMYENMIALYKRNGQEESQLDRVLTALSQAMADILLNGESIEVLDGDVVHSPVLWLTSVLHEVQNREEIRIFKVSVVGAQSCGKSTLLNTLFGLNLPVSTGRCTRGAYMQFVKIDEKLAKHLKCDYLLVIDSEGLMSRLSKNQDYDNELATFVIGLSDLTLVAIKGEGKEMEDVLPIAIHVFLRMKVLRELQACHFVHTNMGAVDVEKKIMPEIDAFVEKLDEKTETAAAEAGEHNYKTFTDVLHYDRKNDNTYVGHLWTGTPPMAKVDIEYSQKIQRLKTRILERAECLTDGKCCSTLEDFSKWLGVIWEAVKYENFVFSFRNVLAIEAYKRLSRILNDKQWKIKKMMRHNIEVAKRKIKNATLTKSEEGEYEKKNSEHEGENRANYLR